MSILRVKANILRETNKRVRHFVAQTNKRKKIPQFCELLRNSYAQFKLTLSDRQKMAPRGQQSEGRLATRLCDDSEANWNGRTDRQTGPRIESG